MPDADVLHSPADPETADAAAAPFRRVRARTVALLVLAAGVGVEVVRRAALRGVPDAWGDPAASLAFQLAVGGLLVLYLRRRGVRVRGLVGRVPHGWRAWGLAAVAAPLLLLSLGTAALQFSLLATLAPGLAAGLQDVDGAAGAATAGTVVAAALAGVMAAAAEELLFRGVLFTRWEQRWGAWRAAVASSLAFGLLHLDPIGAFVFGMAMCCIYLRTRSLLVPILAHAVNNGVVALSDLGGAPEAGPAATDLAPDWGAAALAIAVALPALVWFFRACPPRREWRLPYYDRAG